MVQIRRIESGDGDAYRSILEDTTEEDRYCRFFHAVDHFDPAFIEESVQRTDAMGFIAFEGDAPLGTVHAIPIDLRTAEIAIIVARRGRGRGVARSLMFRAIAESRARGYRQLVGYSMRLNVAFAALARSMGMKPDPMSDGTTITWRLALQATLSPSVAR